MANKSIGKIKYSLALRPSNPSEKDAVKKIYPVVQSDEVVDLELLSQHITEHNSVFSAGTIYGVLKDAVACVIELMTAGKRVKLNGLGTFYVTLSAQGADTVEDFSTSLITRVNPRIAFDKQTFATIKEHADFELTAGREEQAAAIKAQKEALANGESSPSGGGNSGGSGSGDPGDVTP